MALDVFARVVGLVCLFVGFVEFVGVARASLSEVC